MIFKQVFDEKSSTYTYLIASSKGREALIIDPVLDNVEDYLKLLTELDLKLVKVIDTHIHADHVTGGAILTWWVVPLMLIIGFLTPWPYNYWRLKKYGINCH